MIRFDTQFDVIFFMSEKQRNVYGLLGVAAFGTIAVGLLVGSAPFVMPGRMATKCSIKAPKAIKDRRIIPILYLKAGEIWRFAFVTNMKLAKL